MEESTMKNVVFVIYVSSKKKITLDFQAIFMGHFD